MALLYQQAVYYYLLLLFLCNSIVNSHQDHVCDTTQSFALLEFKKSISLGTLSRPCYKPSYPRTTTWNESTDCCTWDGVECDDEGKGHVVGLHLNCSSIHGILDPNSTLFTLSHLQTLDLSSNNFSRSQISPQFGMLTNLKVLDLSFSSFQGEIPLQISHLSKLVSLYLNHNFDLSCSNMVMNQLVGNLTNLRDLDISFTNLSHIKLTSFMNVTPSLEFLSLYSCEFSGLIPSWIYSLPNLKHLNLYRNNFSGFMGDFISDSLEYLYLSDNNLQGEISNSIYRQVNLKDLELRSNNLSGVLNLDMLGKTPSLYWLDISNNTQLSIFSTKVSFAKVFSIDLSYVKLEKIPYFLRNQTSLSQLDLSNNQIVGKIPQWFSELDALGFLDLSYNYLSLGLEVILPMPNLKILYLKSNNFSGIVPTPPNSSSELGHGLIELDLSHNFLSSTLEQVLLNMSNLELLVLKNNNFSGVIVIPPRIKIYIASENEFIGEIPPSICLALNLMILDLSNNRFNGAIPPCLTNIAFLSVLNLKGNNFSGTIPDNFSRGCQLGSLHLNDNQLEGELHPSLLHCENLQVLDLGNNKITGHFPYWLKFASSLRVLILQSNQFYGHITNAFDDDDFSNLRIIDLSHNNFNGPLPSKFFNNLKAIKEMENQKSNSFHKYEFQPYYQDSIVIALKGFKRKLESILLIWKTIDMSSNDFNGEIPNEIGMLRSLVGLNLSHNKLTGEIPTSVGHLKNLESLDLSLNELLGSIPAQLVALTFLSFLNLSHNHLSGPIPQGKQFDTFENSSYFRNVGLCGTPLPKCDAHQNDHKSDDEFEVESLEKRDWVKAVFMGYGCGMVFGISIGFLLFHCGKPMWIMAIVEGKKSSKD